MAAELEREADLAQLYRATTTPRLVDVPPLPFLMLDGHGDPNTSPQYGEAVQALYALSYGVRFAVKRAGGTDHRVSPLEGLWWAEDMTAFDRADRASWQWTAMIRQPSELDEDLLRAVTEDVASRRGLPGLDRVRLETFAEGLAGQILHVGPYTAEGPTIGVLHAFLARQGFHFIGTAHRHHEIYIGDPRRAAPARLRTIIRQAVDAD